MVSEGDLFRRVETGTEKRRSWWLELFVDPAARAREFTKQEGVKAEHVMTRPVISVGEDTPLARAADLRQGHGVKRLPVVREGKLIGILSRADLVRALAATGASQPAVRDDRAIDEALRARLRALGWLDTTYVNFTVENGVVSAFGFVDDAEQKRALRAAVESVPGVRKLDDRLSVYPKIRGAI
jgi:CBS domain-containing protein